MSDCCGNSCGCHGDDDDVQGKIKWQYLRTIVESVGRMNEKNEYEIVPTKEVRPGDIVYIINEDESVRKTLVI